MSFYVPDYRLEPSEDSPVTSCDVCSRDLYKGEDVYWIEGDTICMGCLEDYFEYTLIPVEERNY